MVMILQARQALAYRAGPDLRGMAVPTWRASHPSHRVELAEGRLHGRADDEHKKQRSEHGEGGLGSKMVDQRAAGEVADWSADIARRSHDPHDPAAHLFGGA